MIQPKFKSDLLVGVEKFKGDSTDFVDDYQDKSVDCFSFFTVLCTQCSSIYTWFMLKSTRGPMVEGIPPREASDRLNIYQARFDELWRKYQTYSGGEELFGLEVTEYPDIARIKKELNLLQKLYSLYNDVLEKVNGNYDSACVDIDIDKINQELLEFQNK